MLNFRLMYSKKGKYNAKSNANDIASEQKTSRPTCTKIIILNLYTNLIRN